MRNNSIDYLEFVLPDIGSAKKFFQDVFAWTFTDYSEKYTAFKSPSIEGGFEAGPAKQGSILPVLYHQDLESLQEKITKNGGKITKEIFDFPGGQRFHFTEPNGLKIAVWREKE